MTWMWHSLYCFNFSQHKLQFKFGTTRYYVPEIKLQAFWIKIKIVDTWLFIYVWLLAGFLCIQIESSFYFSLSYLATKCGSQNFLFKIVWKLRPPISDPPVTCVLACSCYQTKFYSPKLNNNDISNCAASMFSWGHAPRLPKLSTTTFTFTLTPLYISYKITNPNTDTNIFSNGLHLNIKGFKYGHYNKC